MALAQSSRSVHTMGLQTSERDAITTNAALSHSIAAFAHLFPSSSFPQALSRLDLGGGSFEGSLGSVAATLPATGMPCPWLLFSAPWFCHQQ